MLTKQDENIMAYVLECMELYNVSAVQIGSKRYRMERGKVVVEQVGKKREKSTHRVRSEEARG